MNRYLVTVRIQGKNVRTVVDADSAMHARLLVDYRFGFGNLIGQPQAIAEGDAQYPLFDDLVAAFENIQPIKPIKPNKPIKPPATPEQARINMLKQNKDRADAALKSERDRQKTVSAQKTLFKTMR
jgi:hypothetical protein